MEYKVSLNEKLRKILIHFIINFFLDLEIREEIFKMNKNKEWFFLYIISLIFFGIFIALLNIEFIENVFLVCNTETGALNFLVSIGIGLILYIPFFIIWGMINSWILNLVYIYIYKSNNYSFLSYDFSHLYT